MTSVHRFGQAAGHPPNSLGWKASPAVAECYTTGLKGALTGPAMPLMLVSLGTAVLTIGVVGPISFVFGWNALWLTSQGDARACRRVRIGWLIYGLNFLLVAAVIGTMLWMQARNADDGGATNASLVA